MRALAISKNTRNYTPVEFLKEKPRPVFTIKSMLREEHLQLLASANIDNYESEDELAASKDLWKTLINDYKTSLGILETHLSGWECIPDEAGDALEFSKDNMKLLAHDIVADLVKQITGSITKEEEKNSDKPSK